MNKKHVLALLSGICLFAVSVFGKSKDKQDVRLDDMRTPEEVSPEVHKKSPNPFLKQDRKLERRFNLKDIFATGEKSPFIFNNIDPDPWDWES